MYHFRRFIQHYHDYHIFYLNRVRIKDIPVIRGIKDIPVIRGEYIVRE